MSLSITYRPMDTGLVYSLLLCRTNRSNDTESTKEVKMMEDFSLNDLRFHADHNLAVVRSFDEEYDLKCVTCGVLLTTLRPTEYSVAARFAVDVLLPVLAYSTEDAEQMAYDLSVQFTVDEGEVDYAELQSVEGVEEN